MRLTLRTLLAYRDRVLNAGELADMHARVQQSAMASKLIQRLSTLSQRANILAPPIDGKGLGADANSIAEYLDDSLHGEKVPELERICLESDVQLAELAQCHSLLSSALSTAVEVPDNLRQRVIAFSDPQARARALAERSTDHGAESEHKPADRVTNAQPSEAATVSTQSSATPAADTTERRSRFRTDPAHQASAAGNGKSPKPERVLVTAQPVAAPMMTTGGDSIRPSGLDLEGSHLAHEVPEYLRGRSRDGWMGPLAIGALIAVLCLLVWQSVGSWDSVGDMLAKTPTRDVDKDQDKTAAADATNRELAGKASVSNPTDKLAVNGLPSLDSNKQPVPNATAVTPAVPAGEPIPQNKNAAPSDSIGPTIVPEQPSSTDTTLSAAADAVAQWLPADVSAMQAVLLVQVGELPLHRLQPTESVPTATQLFVPSSNRPKLDIVRSVRWQVCGMTHMILMQPESSADTLPTIDLRVGRAVLSPSANGRAIQLASPAGQVKLSLADDSSLAAIELSYVPKIHGLVTDRNAYPAVLTVYGLGGSVNLELAGTAVAIPSGSMTSVMNGKASAVQVVDAPQWSESAFERPVDQLAASDLAKAVSNDQNIGDTLQKLATHRRPEMRAMAAQTLALLGNWDWVANPKGSLSEPRDRTFWGPLIDRTRQILAAHPENAEALTAALTALDPNTAQWRAQLWLGLTGNGLQKESLTKVVAGLESEALIDRILSIQQLQRMTGKDLGYQASEINRNQVQQWQRELASGRLEALPVPKS